MSPRLTNVLHTPVSKPVVSLSLIAPATSDGGEGYKVTQWLAMLSADLIQMGRGSHFGFVHEIKIIGRLVFEHAVPENLKRGGIIGLKIKQVNFQIN